MSWTILTNKTGKHNKYWKYTIEGLTVHKEWGRIGTSSPDTQSKSYATMGSARAAIEQEASKKLRKGYEITTDDSFQKDNRIAESIGTQWKITRLEFLNEPILSGLYTYSLSDDYNQDNGVVVEALNSWTKQKKYILVNKHNFIGFKEGKFEINEVNLNFKLHDDISGFVNGIKRMISDLASTVRNNVLFAAVGRRAIGDTTSVVTSVSNHAVLEVAKASGVSEQVVLKFASLGSRVLDL